MHKETRECPKEFTDRLYQFGINPYGEPIFKFAWGRTSFIRMGNIWRDRFGNERRGYRDRCQNHEMQCWTLMLWRPASFYASPESYYANTWDPVSKLYSTGEYPWRGRYEPVQPFMRHEFIDGKMVIEHMPLNHFLIDKLLPILLSYKRLNKEQQQAARDFEKNEQDRREVEEIAERMAEQMPAFINPVSFSKQGCRTSLLDKKMHAIQQQWNRLSAGGKRPRFQKGFQMGDKPIMN